MISRISLRKSQDSLTNEMTETGDAGIALNAESAGRPGTRKNAIEVRHVGKAFGGTQAVVDVSFSVPEGSFLSLLGQSGSGKTTTLRMIAGLEAPTSGSIEMNGQVVSSAESKIFVPPERRQIGFVFQTFALWPHMTTFEQVAYPLRVRRDRKNLRERVREALALVDLADYGDRLPSQLSGGQQQRVALARALVYKPSVLLLDEPLSSLDTELREYMRNELQQLHYTLGITMVYVTHDQLEAMSLSDNVVLMRNGLVVEQGAPEEIYDRPQSLETARFIGSSNILRGTVVATAGKTITVVLDCGPRFESITEDELEPGTSVSVVIKPHEVRLGGAENCVDSVVQNVLYAGSHVELILQVGTEQLRARGDSLDRAELGSAAVVSLPGEALKVFRA
jgi:iron(III) transport system ATP-binding protein